MSKLTVKAITQENLFEIGKNRYYVQMTNEKGKTVTINLGESTYKKIVEVLNNEAEKTVKNEKDKMDK